MSIQPVSFITVEEFNVRLEEGQFTDGGYPIYLLMADGEAMSFDAAKDNASAIREAIADYDDYWLPLRFEINWEDTDLVCVHTGEKIPSAYGND